MSVQLHKKSILKKTVQVGLSSLVSKFLGIIREVLQVKYLGIGELSDAFNVAFKIPNTLRRVFAEGALSAAFIPTLIKIIKHEKQEEANKFMSLMFLTIGLTVFILCILVMTFPKPVVLFFAPGFAQKAIELDATIDLTRILIFFIFFISTSALLSGAMQAKNHFDIPAWGPALLNVIYIGGLIICSYFFIDVAYFSFFLLIGGFLQVVLNLYMYFKLNYIFAWPDFYSWQHFKSVMLKFLPCLFSTSAMEINLWIDGRFASSLPAGSYTLLTLSWRFMGIILSVFAVAFSSILFSHFSRITTYAPRRLSFYLLESAKFIIWITVPALLLMCFFSYDIFYTAFYRFSTNFSLAQVDEASQLLIAFLAGLCFFSINKLCLSIYYAMHETLVPTIISFFCTLANVFLNRLLMPRYGALGLAIATSIAASIQSLFFIWVLYSKFNFTLYMKKFGVFLVQFIAQLSIACVLFYATYSLIVSALKMIVPSYANLLLYHIGLWFWVGPLSLGLFGLLYITRRLFGIKLYFLD